MKLANIVNEAAYIKLHGNEIVRVKMGCVCLIFDSLQYMHAICMLSTCEYRRVWNFMCVLLVKLIKDTRRLSLFFMMLLKPQNTAIKQAYSSSTNNSNTE